MLNIITNDIKDERVTDERAHQRLTAPASTLPRMATTLVQRG